MKIIIEINMDNSAFYAGDLFNPEIEVDRILKDFCKNMYSTGMETTLIDINGNHVGRARVSKRRGE
jgi:hypothetical protein